MSFDRQLGDGDNVGSEPSSRSEQLLDLQGEVKKLIMAKFDSIIKPLVVDLVNERIELAQEKRLTSIERNSENDIRSCEGKMFELRFLNKICQQIFTKETIKGEKSECLQIALVDGGSRNTVHSGPEASIKVEIVLLKGDLDGVEGHDFANMMITKWEGKKSLLMGDLSIYLKEGIGSLDNIYFTHNSKWMKICKFRLGARVVSNDNGIRVKEAMTEPFIVKDRRNELYKKHHHPSPHDDVWRLKNISKGGKFHRRLSEANINTVQEFRRLLNLDPLKLRTILGTGMYQKKWEDTVKHANKTSCTDMPSETGQADAHNLAISASEHQNKTNSLETDTIPGQVFHSPSGDVYFDHSFCPNQPSICPNQSSWDELSVSFTPNQPSFSPNESSWDKFSFPSSPNQCSWFSFPFSPNQSSWDEFTHFANDFGNEHHYKREDPDSSQKVRRETKSGWLTLIVAMKFAIIISAEIGEY